MAGGWRGDSRFRGAGEAGPESINRIGNPRLLRRRRRTFARRRDRGARRAHHQRIVVAERDELIAEPDHLARPGGRGAMDAGRDLVLLRRIDDELDRFRHLRRGRVRPRLEAEREAEVRGADIDRVEAGRLQDGVEIVERLLRLDHRDRQDRLVGVFPVVGAAIHHGADRAERAAAARRVAAVLDELLALGRRVDHRADDAVGAGIERLHDDVGHVPRHAHHRRRVGLRDRLQHRDRVGVVDQAVLHVDHHRVPAAARHALGRGRARDAEPAIDRYAAILPKRFQLVLAQGVSPD